MDAWKWTPDQIDATVRYVSAFEYDSNLILDRLELVTASTLRVRWKLRVKDSRGPGHRLGAPAWDTGKQRHMVAACWHAHRDVMLALFHANPEGRIRSAFINYDGLNDFERTFEHTRRRNVGSMMAPADYGSLCDCNHGATP